jgi:hypothetical protein
MTRSGHDVHRSYVMIDAYVLRTQPLETHDHGIRSCTWTYGSGIEP